MFIKIPPTPTNIFDSHHLLEHKSQTSHLNPLQPCKNISSKTDKMDKHHWHIRTFLKTCGYLNLAKGFFKRWHSGPSQTREQSQRMVHPKDDTQRHKLDSVVCTYQSSEDCKDIYTGETKQPLHRLMAQPKRSITLGQDSVVHLHSWEKSQFSKDSNTEMVWGLMVWKKSEKSHLCKI